MVYFLSDPYFSEHITGEFHPENPKRLNSIYNKLKSSGIFENVIKLKSEKINYESLKSVHDPLYIEKVEEECRKGYSLLSTGDTNICRSSNDVALHAAGGVLKTLDNIFNSKINRGFCSVRPPGHHASADIGMGFCIYNNIALAAEHAKLKYNVEKIMIIDWDVHHGNGTQAILEDDGDILYVSTHQFPYYPGTGNYTETGRGNGETATVNFPLTQGVGDNGFKSIYDNVLIPVLKKFKPQLILVSAGYDAHWKDPLAGLSLSLEGYHWISKALIDIADEICDGRIIFALEGGYDLDVLKNGVANTIRALLHQEDFIDPIGKSPHEEPNIKAYIDQIKKIFSA
ncbi:MAG: histone deacetylase [Candidatus Aminicenantes bacterium]|nr:histone deacetylase [Candidatus Aminicenantes bacterium]